MQGLLFLYYFCNALVGETVSSFLHRNNILKSFFQPNRPFSNYQSSKIFVHFLILHFLQSQRQGGVETEIIETFSHVLENYYETTFVADLNCDWVLEIMYWWLLDNYYFSTKTIKFFLLSVILNLFCIISLLRIVCAVITFLKNKMQ